MDAVVIAKLVTVGLDAAMKIYAAAERNKRGDHVTVEDVDDAANRAKAALGAWRNGEELNERRTTDTDWNNHGE